MCDEDIESRMMYLRIKRMFYVVAGDRLVDELRQLKKDILKSKKK